MTSWLTLNLISCHSSLSIPLKTSENLWFSNVFRGIERDEWNGLIWPLFKICLLTLLIASTCFLVFNYRQMFLFFTYRIFTSKYFLLSWTSISGYQICGVPGLNQFFNLYSWSNILKAFERSKKIKNLVDRRVVKP